MTIFSSPNESTVLFIPTPFFKDFITELKTLFDELNTTLMKGESVRTYQINKKTKNIFVTANNSSMELDIQVNRQLIRKMVLQLQQKLHTSVPLFETPSI